VVTIVYEALINLETSFLKEGFDLSHLIKKYSKNPHISTYTTGI